MFGCDSHPKNITETFGKSGSCRMERTRCGMNSACVELKSRIAEKELPWAFDQKNELESKLKKQMHGTDNMYVCKRKNCRHIIPMPLIST